MNRITCLLAALTLGLSSCKIYSFKDVSIPAEVKSIHIAYLENRARLVNPQLAPQLNDKFRQKVTSQASKLTQIQTSDADYDVSGYVSDYNYSTSGISNQQASSNRLSVTVHIIFKNHLDPTGRKVAPADFEADVTRNFDFPASQTIQEFETGQIATVVTNLTDEIFNKLFSNW
ncbi:LPS assembly lipoprotein LptE [Puia sp. P3]|uniref:LPS assembly lipoprotein LptE n=1 Tax=Puia sp. P3 TaxID=3423952 RepID=UPI003D667236